MPEDPQRPSVPPQPGVAKNDVSMWIGGVVGADDFAGQKRAPKRRRGPFVVIAVVVAAVAGGAGYYFAGRSNTSAPPPDVATVPADAAVTAVDAGADAAVIPADASSSVDAKPEPEPATKKPVIKSVGKKPLGKTKAAPHHK